jgi:NTP pyrophosphatase (non-canonical NTP hydrolase)
VNFQQYRPLALRTAKMFPDSRANLQHATLGLITESGEFATEVKRLFAYGKPLTAEMNAHMREELGDVLWYVPLAMWAMGEVELPETTDEMRDEFGYNLPDLTCALGAMVGGVATLLKYGDDTEDALLMLSAVVYIVERCAEIIGTTGDELRAANIAKLRQRFPDAYSDAAAEARADKGGADARNS